MRNALFFWVKKLMEKMIFTIFADYWEVPLLNFSVMENTVFFWVEKLMERWYLLVTEKFLFWTFRRWEIRSFFQPKSWWKDDIYLVFLSFPLYSGTWEIRFFVQWADSLILQSEKNFSVSKLPNDGPSILMRSMVSSPNLVCSTNFSLCSCKKNHAHKRQNCYD